MRFLFFASPLILCALPAFVDAASYASPYTQGSALRYSLPDSAAPPSTGGSFTSGSALRYLLSEAAGSVSPRPATSQDQHPAGPPVSLGPSSSGSPAILKAEGIRSSPASDHAAHFALGERFFAAGDYEQAYDAFLLAFRGDPANPSYNFQLGRAAFEKRDFEAAVMAYERILIAEPDSPRVKLELARCHLELGSRETAKQYFREVLETNPPEPVWQNIRKFLDAIEAAEKKHFLNGILTVGIQHDDNPRVAPSDRLPEQLQRLFPGIDLQPLEAPASDWAYTTTTVINHVYKIIDSPWSWKTTAVNFNNFYDTEDDLKVVFLGLTSGPVRQTKRYLWETQLLANQVRLDSDRYLDIYGLGASASLSLDQKVQLTLGATLQEKYFRQDHARDASNFRVQGGPVITLGKNRFSLLLARENESAEDEQYSYDRSSFVLRYDRLLPRNFAGYLSYRFEHTRYDQMDNLFGVVRDDDRQEFAAGLSRSLWKAPDGNRSLAAQISYTYTRADSNLALYEYDKNVVTTSLTLGF